MRSFSAMTWLLCIACRLALQSVNRSQCRLHRLTLRTLIPAHHEPQSGVPDDVKQWHSINRDWRLRQTPLGWIGMQDPWLILGWIVHPQKSEKFSILGCYRDHKKSLFNIGCYSNSVYSKTTQDVKNPLIEFWSWVETVITWRSTGLCWCIVDYTNSEMFCLIWILEPVSWCQCNSTAITILMFTSYTMIITSILAHSHSQTAITSLNVCGIYVLGPLYHTHRFLLSFISSLPEKTNLLFESGIAALVLGQSCFGPL